MMNNRPDESTEFIKEDSLLLPNPRYSKTMIGQCPRPVWSKGRVFQSIDRGLDITATGYLAHEKPPPPLAPGHIPSVGSQGGAASYEQGTPVALVEIPVISTHFPQT